MSSSKVHHASDAQRREKARLAELERKEEQAKSEQSSSSSSSKHQAEEDDDNEVSQPTAPAKKRNLADDENGIPKKKSKGGDGFAKPAVVENKEKKRSPKAKNDVSNEAIPEEVDSSSSSSSSFLCTGLDYLLGCKESNAKAISTAFQHLVAKDSKFAEYQILIKESKLLDSLASQKDLSTILKTVLYQIADKTTDLTESEKLELIIGDVVDFENEDVKKGFELWLDEAPGYFSKDGSSLSKAKMAKMKERSDRWSPYRSLASALLLAVGQGVEGRGPLECLKGL